MSTANRKLLAHPVSEGEREKWNAFAETSGMGHVFHTFEWGVFKESMGWRAKRYFLEDRDRGIRAILPVLVKSLGPFGSIWYLPRGPVCDYRDAELVSEVIDILVDLAKKDKAILLKISPDPGISVPLDQSRNILLSKGFRETESYQLHKRTIRVNLTPDLKDIFMNSIASNTRWEIRRARRRGVRIRTGEDESHLQCFYDLYIQALHEGGGVPLPYAYFQNLFSFLSESTTLLVAEDEDGPLSSIWVMSFARRSWYLFGGTTRKRNTKYASQLLHWKAIKLGKAANLDYYDLQGVRSDSKVDGIYRFKRGFSHDEIDLLGEFDLLIKPRLTKFLYTKILPTYRLARYYLGSIGRKPASTQLRPKAFI
jgi:lipid II:glycine glycyltransferase (peptidoglycan interpeptide bridge formation enzyme)